MNRLAFVFVVIMFLIAGGYMHSASAADSLNTQSITDAGWYKLTPAQQATILQQVASQSVDKKDPTVSPENFQKWVDAGTSVGKGLASIVKELGITVNEFLTTPAGKIGIAALIAHVFGHEIINVIGVMVGLCIWLPIWIYTYRRICVLQTVTMERTGFWHYKKTVVYRKNGDSYESENTNYWRIWMLIALIILLGLSFAAL